MDRGDAPAARVVRYLIDTSVIMGHVYGDRRASALLHRLVDNGAELFTSDVIVWECLSRGTDAERDVLERLLASLTYVPVTRDVAFAAAALQRTTKLGMAEALLQAAATSVGAKLVRLGQ
ncbi:MAG: PIN domain-containing protein [Chloroflexi bacterium]|nr:PIN domain-containing protein [Chloroflexota bacterium]